MNELTVDQFDKIEIIILDGLTKAKGATQFEKETLALELTKKVKHIVENHGDKLVQSQFAKISQENRELRAALDQAKTYIQLTEAFPVIE